MALTREFIRKAAKESGVEIPKELEDALIQEHISARDKYANDAVKTGLEGNKQDPAPNIEETQEYKDLEQKLADKEKEYGTLQAKLADRDYTDAVRSAIAGANGGKGVKFSSKAAEKAFLAELKANPLEMKDGALTGFDDYLKNQMDADPDAFQSGDPAPVFSKHIGSGGAPNASPPNVSMAKAMGAAKAATIKAANDVFANYT